MTRTTFDPLTMNLDNFLKEIGITEKDEKSFYSYKLGYEYAKENPEINYSEFMEKTKKTL